jgi:hypothetical protein
LIVDGEIVPSDDRDGRNDGAGDILDLREPGAVLDELTRRGAPKSLRIRTWSGRGDRDLSLSDLGNG